MFFNFLVGFMQINRVTIAFKSLIFILFLLVVAESSADELKPFTSDGCSGFPDGTFKQGDLWLGCCTAHDYAYWKGGSEAEREQADFALKACVASVGEEEIAVLMLVGVWVGGAPYIPSPFRWGYGWSYPKLYAELTPEEIKQIENEIEKIENRDKK